MRTPMRLLKAMTIGMMLPSSVQAQAADLRPVSEYMMRPEDRRDAAYPFLRSISLYQGLFQYGGANFSDEFAASTQRGIDAMALVALLFRQEKHPTFDTDDLAKQLGLVIESVTHIYLDRMTRNYALSGEAYSSDATIVDDFETCGLLMQLAIGHVSDNP